MTDRGKVIKGLECCIVGDGHGLNCEECPYTTYGDDTCDSTDALHGDALALLKAQEAHAIDYTTAEVIDYLQQQIDWINDNEAHQFPGWGHTVTAMHRAIRLLKAQEPRVLTLEEVQMSDSAVTLEIREVEEEEYNGMHTALHVAELDYEEPPVEVFGIAVFENTSWFSDGTYGKKWRCWSARPTDEQREAVKWDE